MQVTCFMTYNHELQITVWVQGFTVENLNLHINGCASLLAERYKMDEVRAFVVLNKGFCAIQGS